MVNSRKAHLPPFAALRAFEAMARLGSFSAAGRALNVTHAAVSQQVRSLEAHLGLALAHRDGRAMRLTEEGRQLAASLTEAFALIETTLANLAEADPGQPVHVTMPPSFATQWLMPRLARFWKQHPDIAVSFHPAEEAVDLRREGMDLGIRFGLGHWAGAEAEFLFPAHHLIVGAPCLLEGRSILTPAEMMALPWVREADWPEQLQWMAGLGFDPAQIEFTEFPNEELALLAALEGYGLLVQTAAIVGRYIESGRLVSVFDTADSDHGYYIVTPPGPRRPAAKAFIRWLRSET